MATTHHTTAPTNGPYTYGQDLAVAKRASLGNADRRNAVYTERLTAPRTVILGE
jgi:hypothetical protein